MPPPRRTIAHHLVFTGYAHWLSNDPRGSGSTEVRNDEFAALGPIHLGRELVQPPRETLRAFYRNTDPLLQHEKIWFDDAKRQALAEAFATTIASRGYTCWAAAVCSNHVHLIIRIHRDDALTIWNHVALDSRLRLRELNIIPIDHPLWSERPYKVFLYTPADVRNRIDYVNDNPLKERLPRQSWPFVIPYNNWPFHKQSPRP